MNWVMFLDDERYPARPGPMVCRSTKQAICAVNMHGCPEHIAFDHDLGGDDTGKLFAHWIIDQVLDGELAIPKNFTYSIHSANPVGAANIRGYLDQGLRVIFGEGERMADPLWRSGDTIVKGEMIWECVLDDRYRCEVTRLSHQQGRLTVTDGGETLLDEVVNLSYTARVFGPNAMDMAEWQEISSRAIQGEGPEPQ